MNRIAQVAGDSLLNSNVRALTLTYHCHKAWSASNFLRYIGKKNTLGTQAAFNRIVLLYVDIC